MLVATSTLAAGVNLPAGRVIIRSLKIGGETLGVVQYRQMVGRAGRPGFSTPVTSSSTGEQTTEGESYLVVSKKEKDKAVSLIQQPLPCVFSQIHPKSDGGKGLLKAILEMYGLGLCTNIEHVRAYVRHTLLWFQADALKGVKIKIIPREIGLDGVGNSSAVTHVTSVSGEVGMTSVVTRMRSRKEGGGAVERVRGRDEAVMTAQLDNGDREKEKGGVEGEDMKGTDEGSAVLHLAAEVMNFLVEARALGPFSAAQVPSGMQGSKGWFASERV